MFSKSVIDSDTYMNLPLSAQALYFHLSMRADDDGFVGNPKTILRMTGCKSEDFKVLIEAGFIIEFESGIACIRHWHVNNYIQNDRYKPTVYKAEKTQIRLDESDVYTLDTECIQVVSNTDTQVSIGKDRLGKDSLGKVSLGKEINNRGGDGGGDDARARENEPEKCEEPENSWTEQIKRAISLLNEETRTRLVRTTETLVKVYWAQSFCGDYDVCRCYSILSWFKRSRKNPVQEFTLTDDDIELLSEVFSVSADTNKRNWAYIKGIYRKFKARGIHDIDSYMKYEFERNQGRT